MTSTPEGPSTDPLTVSVLRALADGATDAQVARALHVSPRTVQRVVNGFKSATGARTRLAVGAAACRLGLLDRGDRGDPGPSGPGRHAG